MRILIANKYYFMKGGAERYLFNVKALLESHGHVVVPFGIRFARIEPTPYARYFVEPPAGEHAEELEQFRLRPTVVPRMVLTAFYSPHAKARLREVIRRERIDLVYMLNISNYISPSIIDGARAEGIPVMHRLSDFTMVCPSAIFNRRRKNRCFDCLPGKYWHGIIHRCVGGSLGASVVRCASMFFHDAIRIYHRADGFVCSTSFMREILVRRGFKPERAHVIPTPIDASRIEVSSEDDGTFLCASRISREKGIDTLVEAAKRMRSKGQRIIIAGEVEGQYAVECMRIARRAAGARVEFIGPRYGEAMWQLLRRCRATILPSRCIDNSPNAVLESFACGKPVVGSNVEGVSALVRDGENGLLFEPENADDLAGKLDALAADPERARRMGLAGRAFVEERHSPDRHYTDLMRLFESAIEARRKRR